MNQQIFAVPKKLRTPETALHNLILSQATGVLGTLHGVAIAQISVLDIGQAQRSATVLVTSELG